MEASPAFGTSTRYGRLDGSGKLKANTVAFYMHPVNHTVSHELLNAPPRQPEKLYYGILCGISPHLGILDEPRYQVKQRKSTKS